MAEKEHPKAEKRYAKKAEKKPESKAEEKSESKSEPDSEEKGETHAAPKMDMRAEMVKRHLKEARDLHGQHRDAMKMMHGRQESEMKQISSNMGPANGDQDQMGEQVQQPGEGQAGAE